MIYQESYKILHLILQSPRSPWGTPKEESNDSRGEVNGRLPPSQLAVEDGSDLPLDLATKPTLTSTPVLNGNSGNRSVGRSH